MRLGLFAGVTMATHKIAVLAMALPLTLSGCMYPMERTRLIEPIFTAPHVLSATDTAGSGRWAEQNRNRHWNVDMQPERQADATEQANRSSPSEAPVP